jgi:hypothetical protein
MTSCHFVVRKTINELRRRTSGTLCVNVKLAALTIAAAVLLSPQQQRSTSANWPCGARIDPSYFHLAEATGGQLLLLAPSEIASSADLSIANTRHPETIFRLAGTINPGVHEFRVPIDGSVEIAMFSISVQCLQTAEVVRPSGAPASGTGVVDLSNFVATRMVTVEKPEAGTWTVRASGSGVAGVAVKARSEIHITSVEFAPRGSTAFTNVPSTGVENTVRIRVRGRLGHLEGALIDAAAKPIGPLPLESAGDDGVYRSRFAPGADGFRVMITGTADDGSPVQRVYAPLLTAR